MVTKACHRPASPSHTPRLRERYGGLRKGLFLYGSYVRVPDPGHHCRITRSWSLRVNPRHGVLHRMAASVSPGSRMIVVKTMITRRPPWSPHSMMTGTTSHPHTPRSLSKMMALSSSTFLTTVLSSHLPLIQTTLHHLQTPAVPSHPSPRLHRRARRARCPLTGCLHPSKLRVGEKALSISPRTERQTRRLDSLGLREPPSSWEPRSSPPNPRCHQHFLRPHVGGHLDMCRLTLLARSCGDQRRKTTRHSMYHATLFPWKVWPMCGMKYWVCFYPTLLLAISLTDDQSHWNKHMPPFPSPTSTNTKPKTPTLAFHMNRFFRLLAPHLLPVGARSSLCTSISIPTSLPMMPRRHSRGLLYLLSRLLYRLCKRFVVGFSLSCSNHTIPCSIVQNPPLGFTPPGAVQPSLFSCNEPIQHISTPFWRTDQRPDHIYSSYCPQNRFWNQSLCPMTAFQWALFVHHLVASGGIGGPRRR